MGRDLRDPPEPEGVWWKLTFVEHSLDVQPILLNYTVAQLYHFGCETWRSVLPSVCELLCLLALVVRSAYITVTPVQWQC